MSPLILVIGVWAIGLVLASVPSAPRWSPWLSPVLLAGLYTREYIDDRNATSGDPQPGLIMLVGLIVVAVATVLVVVGLLIRDGRARQAGNRADRTG